MSDPNTPIEQRIQKFYQRQKLSPEKLQELKALTQPQKVDPRPTPRFRTNLYTYAAFAAVVLLLFIGSLFGVRRYNENQHIQAVAAEIALNHAKRFNTEFESPNIANLSTQMHLLDFSPVLPQKMAYDSYEMIGARYCTIENAIAVQIHLEDEDDAAYTLYEFRDPSAFLSNDERTIDVDGIEVQLWKEGEVIMGLAHKPDLSSQTD